MNSVVFKSIDREGVKQAVFAFAASLRQEHPEVKRVVWFGSWVSGLPVPGSDVDLCLILEHSEKPPHERISDYLAPGFPVGIDLFTYTQDEFEGLKTSSPGWYAAIIKGIDIE